MILTCAKLCEESYDDGAPGFITVGDLRYGVFNTQLGTIICIRGTANLDNWLTDIKVIPAKTCGGFWAHKGFVEAYRELCNHGMPTTKGQKVIATGHSLGGAIATLLAEHTGCALVTFGSPKVYWRFGKVPNINHLRMVRDDDPVPEVPKIFYKHQCGPIVLKDSDDHILQVKDHYMAGYMKMIKERRLDYA